MLRWLEIGVNKSYYLPSILMGDKIYTCTTDGINIHSELGEVVVDCSPLFCFTSGGYLCAVEDWSSGLEEYFPSMDHKQFGLFLVARNIDDPNLCVVYAEKLATGFGLEIFITRDGLQIDKHRIVFDGKKFIYNACDMLDYKSLIKNDGDKYIRIIAFDEETRTMLITINGKYYSVNADEHSPEFMTYELIGKNLVLTTNPIGRFYD